MSIYTVSQRPPTPFPPVSRYVTTISHLAVSAREQARETTGQFGTQTRTAPGDITLSSLHDWEPADDSFPYPQANDLEKVVAVVDLVHGGVDTPEGIADALDLHHREGAYYANAAGWLGLVERGVDESGITVYVPTELGTDIQRSDPDGRALAVGQMVAGLDDAILALDNQSALVAQLNRDGLGDTTAHRRASTMLSWALKATDPDGFSTSIVDASALCSTRSDGARQICVAQRKAALEAFRPSEPKRGEPCPTCWTEMPLAATTCFQCN